MTKKDEVIQHIKSVKMKNKYMDEQISYPYRIKNCVSKIERLTNAKKMYLLLNHRKLSSWFKRILKTLKSLY